MFPWESALTGEEVCPAWAGTGLREIHINGDIAMAVWEYYRSIDDNGNAWLSEVGYPMLQGIATFWMSRLAVDNPSAAIPGWNPTGDGAAPLHILNVIGPDEYADHTNDSVFTNVGARFTLSYAATAAQLLERPRDEYAPWLNASSRIVVLYNDSAPGIVGGMHPEHTGYFNVTVKQADVVIIPLLRDITTIGAGNFTRQSVINDLLWYSRVTDPGGPAMTWGVFAGGFAQAGQMEAAAHYFNQSFGTVAPPFNVWFEMVNASGTPGFLTGAGGFLQAPLFFYPQLRVGDDAMTLEPLLTEGASSAKIRGASYLGNRLDIEYDGQALRVTLQRPQQGTGGAADVAPAGGAASLHRSTLGAVGSPQAIRAYASPCSFALHDASQQAACLQQAAAFGAQHARTADKLAALPATHGDFSTTAGAAGRGVVSAVAADGDLSLWPRIPLARRSQVGQVAIEGYRVRQQDLVLVDAWGVAHSLTVGSTLVLPLQRVSIQAA
jgi:hypothetical protein